MSVHELRPKPAGLATRDWDYLIQPGRVHRSLYLEADIFRDEMMKIFGATWVYLAHESEIPERNDFITKRMGLRPLIVARDGDGKVNALLNRCTHRGATVCRTERGKAKFFTCGYHCWTFKNDGECVGIPMPDAFGPGFKVRDKSLGRVPRLEIYRGFIFGSMNPDVAPLVDYLAGARKYLDEWLDRFPNGNPVFRASTQRYLNHSNWKTYYDNAGDGYHPAYSHESMLSITTLRHGEGMDMTYFAGDTDQGPLYTRSLGNGHTLVDQRPEMHARSAWKHQRPQPGREWVEERMIERMGEEKAIAFLDNHMGAGMNLCIFPNLFIVGNQLQVLEPITVDKTAHHWYASLAEDVPAEVNSARMRTQEDFPMFGEVDDSGNFEACQSGMAVPEMEWIDISRHLETGRSWTDKDGYETQPVTSDLHMRSYYAEYKKLMKATPRLTYA